MVTVGGRPVRVAANGHEANGTHANGASERLRQLGPFLLLLLPLLPVLLVLFAFLRKR